MLERVLSAVLGLPFLLGAASSEPVPSTVVCTLQDPALVEGSALVVANGLILDSNDSGDTGRVFAIDPATGDTVGVTHWSDDPVDVEALAPAPPIGDNAAVWVGDIGDNNAVRSSIQIARVPVGKGDRTVAPKIYNLVYPDGAHNAETLVRNPNSGRLYIATKESPSGELFIVPKKLSTTRDNTLVAVAPVLTTATDGTFFPNGKHLIIRGYGMADVYSWPSMEMIDSIRLPSEPQGEGLGIDANGSLLLDSEGRNTDVLKLTLPSSLQRIVEPPPSASSPTPSASVETAASTVASAPGESAQADRDDGFADTAGTHLGVWTVGVGVLVLGLLVAGVGRRRRR